MSRSSSRSQPCQVNAQVPVKEKDCLCEAPLHEIFSRVLGDNTGIVNESGLVLQRILEQERESRREAELQIASNF